MRQLFWVMLKDESSLVLHTFMNNEQIVLSPDWREDLQEVF